VDGGRNERTVAPGVIQVHVPGASVFLLLDRRVTLVDAGLPGSADRILAALAALGRGADEIDQVVITHYHIDHAGGLAALRRRVPARVAVHAAEAPFLRGEVPAPVPLAHPLIARPLRPLRRVLTPPPVHVDTWLHHGDELPVLGGLRVIHTPGHTPGHIALHLPARGLLIGGDALQVRPGRRLVPPHRLFTEDWAEALRSLRRLANVEFETLALSHFPPQRGDARARLHHLAQLHAPARRRRGAAVP
jgi:glyoxylase-like metal-dependent hydrolase (beta-lactamase superfamily II)